jgi:hypothetical protein
MVLPLRRAHFFDGGVAHTVKKMRSRHSAFLNEGLATWRGIIFEHLWQETEPQKEARNHDETLMRTMIFFP